MTAPVVSIVVPTWNGAGTLPALLAAAARAARRHPLEVVAIDSGSSDETVPLLRAAGARILDLGGATFGHASARNRAAAYARGRILVWLTQDVAPDGDEWLGVFLEALDDPRVAGVFGRQLPRDASPEEAYLVGVNYPDAPRRIDAAAVAGGFGPGRLFYSSAFAAMRREVWERVPFPDVVMSEDQAWAMAVASLGLVVEYAPRARALHGHRLSLGRAFRRNFDSGSALGRLGLAGIPLADGVRHLAGELRWIAARHGVRRIPRTLVYELVRVAGFACGRLEPRLPRAVAAFLGEAPRALPPARRRPPSIDTPPALTAVGSATPSTRVRR